MIKAGQTALAADFTISVLAGENLTANDAVYILPADGKAYKCDADDLTKIDFAGFAQETISSGAAVTIKISGLMTGFSSLTIGAVYYLSGTAGGVTSTAPTNRKIVGTALSATVIKISQELTKRVRVYTSTDTWTKYQGLKYIDVEVQAAGGNGGSASAGSNNCDTSAGGGGGGYSRKNIQAGALSATETVTVGAVGASSSFGAHCSATSGSTGGGRQGGSGGVGSGGDINIAGQAGANSESLPGGEGDYMAGNGGSSVLGGGGQGAIAPNNSGANGGDGGSYGGGGGGAGANDGNSGSGGAGGAAVVIVTEYY